MTAEQLTFVTLVIGILLGLYKDNRDRKWKIEDLARQDRVAKDLADGLNAHRAALAEKVETTAARVADKVERTAERVADKVDAAASLATERMVVESGKLGVKIDDNTDISKKAFHEANGAKILIAEEIKQRNEIALAANGHASPAIETTLAQIEQNTADTAKNTKGEP